MFRWSSHHVSTQLPLKQIYTTWSIKIVEHCAPTATTIVQCHNTRYNDGGRSWRRFCSSNPVQFFWRRPLQKYRLSAAAKPGRHIPLQPLCGCAQKLKVVLTAGPKRYARVACGKPTEVDIEWTRGRWEAGWGGTLTARLLGPSTPPEPPEMAGKPAPLKPAPPSDAAHAKPEEPPTVPPDASA